MNNKCRYCGNELVTCMADLGLAPLSNDYLIKKNIEKGEHTLPLIVYHCTCCNLVQIANYEKPEGIFDEGYKYFSSFSKTWLKHCENYVDMIVERLSLNSKSKVLEIASNDGYLLQYFKKYNINPLGIEPSTATANVARKKGIDTIDAMFDHIFAELFVKERGKYDLIIGNNVLAHVPYIGDFVSGLNVVLSENGTITMEFPHLLNLIKYGEFDTIYHEHFSYLSIIALKRIFMENGLKIYDVEKISTHGGSLRIYATHLNNENLEISPSVEETIKEETAFGLDNDSVYESFSDMVIKRKYEIWSKIIELKKEGKTIVGYGAAAKGNTLFNYCGIKSDEIEYIADLNPYKQNLYCPGSLIPIVEPGRIMETKPDVVIIIPWNIKSEIANQLSFIKDWGGVFMTLIPEIEMF